MCDCIDHKQKGGRKGYGSAWLDGKTIKTHRKVFLETYWGLPPVVRHTCAKITGQQALQIRAEYIPHRRECSTTALARKYNVSHHLVWRIMRNKTWWHLHSAA